MFVIKISTWLGSSTLKRSMLLHSFPLNVESFPGGRWGEEVLVSRLIFSIVRGGGHGRRADLLRPAPWKTRMKNGSNHQQAGV